MNAIAQLIVEENEKSLFFAVAKHLTYDITRIAFFGIPLLKITHNFVPRYMEKRYLLFHKIPIFRVRTQTYFKKIK